MESPTDQVSMQQSSPAIEWPATRAALRRNWFFRWPLLLIGIACGGLCLLLINEFDRPGIHGAERIGRLLISPTAVIFTICTILGGTFVWIGHRRRRSVKRHAWTRWKIQYIRAGRNEWVMLLDPHRTPVSALILSTWPKDLGKLVDHNTPEIWFAGDPKRYGVISRPGGEDLRYAYYSKARQPPRFTFTDRAEGPRSGPEHSSTAGNAGYQLSRENGTVVMQSPTAKPTPPRIRYGSLHDSGYPSPRKLRRTCAFIVDVALHLLSGIAIALLVAPGFSPEALRTHDIQQIDFNPLIALGCWLAASFVDRVAIQSSVHTTIGKAIFGLVAIQPDTNRYPTFGRLLATWLFHLYLPLAILGDGIGPDDDENYFMTAVRWRDVRERNRVAGPRPGQP